MSEYSVYALVLKGTVDVQGLVAIQYDDNSKAVHIIWACTAPWNNKAKKGLQVYEGTGGHVLAIAAELSLKNGYEGYIYGEAINQDVYRYYIDVFQATPIPTGMKPFRFAIEGKKAQKLMEVYNYEWTEEEL